MLQAEPSPRRARGTHGPNGSPDRDEIESVARIGSYSLDIASGRWVSSKGLDTIFGIDAAYDRSVQGWAALVHPEDREATLAYLADEVLGRRRPFDRQYRIVSRATGQERHVHGRGRLRLDASGRPREMFGTIADITDRRLVEIERERLALAIEHVSNAVVVTDLAGTIEYVNPAFEQISGYGRAEAVGQNPRILKSGRQPAGFYRAMWRRLTRGETWTGRFTNRRSDDQLYEVEATISPIRGSGGAIGGYVAVERDVTALLAARTELANEYRERAQVSAALGRIQPGETAEATSEILCDELLGLPGIDYAAILGFASPTRATPLAARGPDGMLASVGKSLPDRRAAYLYDRAAQGPWAEALELRPTDDPFRQRLTELGIQAIAYAPIRNGAGLLGVVVAGTSDDRYGHHLVDHLPIVGEFAATASALLAGPLERGLQDAVVRRRIEGIVARHELRPVFQPIVDLGSGAVVGYEALTRFDDGTAPDRLIAEARAAGIGTELEMACLTASLEAEGALPPDPWLGLNVSPALAVSDMLPALLRRTSRRIVLEITEHVEIADYAAVRGAVARLGPSVSLAVDDAGAGFASLRHVVELKPQFLKLDISLVRSVARDPTRQAMVAGLSHFAVHAGCTVIAEGVEAQEDLERVREIGVTLGQGYLLGRPESAAVSPTGSRRRRTRP